jgi:hypothetical protein
MGSTAGRVCFLTLVRGDFEGGGEEVRIWASGGSWYLGGQSLQLGVHARARCARVSSYSGEYSWWQGQNPRWMGTQTQRACFLTRVGGKFEGGGERVEIYGSAGHWYLGGSSLQVDVHAGARCASVPFWGAYKWDYKAGGPVILAGTNWGCFLAGMMGKFEGGAEFVRTFASGGSFYVQAHGVQPTWGKAGCMWN